MAGKGLRVVPPPGPRAVWIVAFPDVQILDVTGPLEVFSIANRIDPSRRPGYEVSLVAPAAGPVVTSSGVRLVAPRGLAQATGPVDTLIVAGGLGTRAALRDRRFIAWTRRTAARARRVASVCTGAFLLGEAGLIETTGRSVAEVAERCGFRRVETMHRAFRRRLRVAPAQYRRHFRAAR